MSMFCYQCQEAAKNQGCTVRGVCGKNAEVVGAARPADLALKGLSFYGVRARELGVAEPETDHLCGRGAVRHHHQRQL